MTWVTGDDAATDIDSSTSRRCEHAVSEHLYRPVGVGVAVLAAFGGPVGLARATAAQLREATKAAAPRIGDTVADSIEAALGEQTVTVPGAEKADFVLGTLARQLQQVREARADLEVQFAGELDRHPAGPILTSMPGVAARTAVTMLVEMAEIDRFHNAATLPSTPASRPAPTAPEHPSAENTANTAATPDSNAPCTFSAFASLREPASRAYHDRKRAGGKNHRAALICLARRRSNVLYAMLKSGSAYCPRGAPEARATAWDEAPEAIGQLILSDVARPLWQSYEPPFISTL